MKETEVYGMKYEPKEKEYNQYVETVTPTSNSFRNCLWAFLVGGLICTIGQVGAQFRQNTRIENIKLVISNPCHYSTLLIKVENKY